MNYLTAVGTKVTVVTKHPNDYIEKDRYRILECLNLLKQHEIKVITKERIHQKYAIIDQKIIWYGSINLLSYGVSEESIMRIESVDIATELVGHVQR